MSSTKKDDLRAEYEFDKLEGGVRGKYSEAGQMVAIEPELAEAFPTAKAVNEALRELLARRKEDRR